MKTVMVISDSTGETADRMVRAALQQFRRPDVNVRVFSRVRLESEVEKLFGEATKNFPLIKLMARIQRFWQTKIRRGEYQYFITNSFSGEIL